MKFRKNLLLWILAALLLLAGCQQEPSVPTTVPPETEPPVEQLAMVVTEDTIVQLEQYPALKRVDLTGSTCYAAIAEYMQKHPGVDVTYAVQLGTAKAVDDATTLLLDPGACDYATLAENLQYLPKLESVSMPRTTLSPEEIVALQGLYPQISWEAKSGALAQIARSLNIGIDALALIDDSVFERTEVAAVHPQVRTYTEEQAEKLVDLPEFSVPATAESRTRRIMYRAEERRSALLAAEKTDITDFLRRCNLGITVFVPGTEEEKLRCYELVVRTNQLNMSGVKYTPEEFEGVLERAEHTNFGFSCADDLGSYGIVGFGQYRREGEKLIFTEFAMSCRVAGKFVESALFAHLLEREGCETGLFAVQKTKKNILLRSSLESIGFTAGAQDDAQVTYQFTSGLKNSSVVQIR